MESSDQCVVVAEAPPEEPPEEPPSDEAGALPLPQAIGELTSIPASELETLRTTCPFGDDQWIIDGLLIYDGIWEDGFSYQWQLDQLRGTDCAQDSLCFNCLLAQIDFVYLVAHTQPPPVVAPPTPPTIQVVGVLIADDGTFLGNVNSDQYDTDSIANRYGTYGSVYGTSSIWNEYGSYGSEYASLSAWNPYTSTPPCIYQSGVCVTYVTASTYIQPSIHPAELAVTIGRTDVLR